ncbi:unnamed protein product [Ectocarpus sp. CCAP 1310/34]|nr:unnamed protein product [Ectocarpus sp. CCAP 1310/34]
MEEAPDLSSYTEEDRQALAAHIKEEVEKKVQQKMKEQEEKRPASESVDMPPDGGDPRHARPAGTALNPQPEDQPRSLEDGLVDLFARAMRSTNTPGEETREVVTPKDTIRVSPVIQVAPFTGVLDSSGDVQVRVQVFESQFRMLWQLDDCLNAIVSEETIRVGKSDADIPKLKEEYGRKAIEKAMKAWELILAKIQVASIVPAIISSGCPTESWRIFRNHFQLHAHTERTSLQLEWQELTQGVQHHPKEYLSRGWVLRQRLSSWGVKITEDDANRHLVRNLLPEYVVYTGFLMSESGLEKERVERIIVNAWAEMEARRKKKQESVGAHALVTGGENRSGGGGNTGGPGKTRGQRRMAARQQKQQPQQPQHQHQPYFNQ